MTNVEEEFHRVASLHLDNLNVVAVLGRGAKGVVFLVRSSEDNGDNGDFLALKTVVKKSLWESTSSRRRNNNTSYGGNGVPDSISSGGGGGDKGYRRICFEEDVLALLDHPLLPKLRGVLETDRIVGYAIDYCPGGDLNSLRRRQTEKMFSDDTIRFYAAEIVLALEYLHGIGIVYRDLKPENVMIQENGHLMLVDFDLSTKLSTECRWSGKSSSPELLPAKSMTMRKKKKSVFSPLSLICKSGIVNESDSIHPVEISSDSSSYGGWDAGEKSNSFVGTEEYLAPEVISGKGHDFSVDWWCFGVMLYEMLYGTTPFRGSDRKETYYRILVKSPELVGETTPLRDLIGKLLEKAPKKRISLEGIKRHEFFKNIDWDKLLEISRPPFIPTVEDSGRNLQINLESFVFEVFHIQDDDENLKSRKIENNGVWVEGLNNQHAQNEDFFPF